MCYCAASPTRQYFALDADPSLQIATYRTAAKIILSWVVIGVPLCRQFEPFRDGPKSKSKKVLNSLYTTHSIALETGNAGESDWTAGLISLCDCQLFHLVASPQTTPARTCIRRSMHAVGDRFTNKLCRPLRFPSPANSPLKKSLCRRGRVIVAEDKARDRVESGIRGGSATQ